MDKQKNEMRKLSVGGWVRWVTPEMNQPSLKDNTGDVDRLIKGLRKALNTEEITIDLELIRNLPARLREDDYNGRCLVYREGVSWRVMDFYSGGGQRKFMGLAVDLGSSTVVIRLVDMRTGVTLDEISFLNPQSRFGSDILTRIHYAAREGGLKELQTLVIDGLNKQIQDLANVHGINPDDIIAMTLAGNTTMTHFFLGLDPFWLCREPYIPVLNSPDILTAIDLGIGIHKRAPILIFPNVGSYLGGDLVAGIIASGMAEREETALLVDVGTNAEVVLGNREWLMACAGAAGPALEGGVANMGMMAGPGVIDRVTIDPEAGELDIRTIDQKPPIGICGSGLIDLAAHLFLNGMIDQRGKLVSKACGERFRIIDSIKHFVVVPAAESGSGKALTLCQPDIDALLRSKAAMYTILSTITQMVRVPLMEINRFYIAGTFGTYIDPRSAITIGMIPDLPVDTYVSLGNTSLQGATKALLSAEILQMIRNIRDRITYIELNVNQEFMNLFSAAKFIPHTDRALFPSVKEKLLWGG